MRHDGALILLDEQGKPLVEFRPSFYAGTGPVVTLWRVSGPDPEYLATLRLPIARVIVRRLPLVIAAAMRLQARARNTAK